ncbi:MAG: Na+/H+ antiporter subunit E [Deltaproteobacteria bacterium]|nr:MAG: Na+/H+ antiporter subunit E [Deltaproteobacteria bacterium]
MVDREKQYSHQKQSQPESNQSSLKIPPTKKSRTPFLLTFFVAFATWIVLSGKFDLFHLTLGIISCLIVASFSGDLMLSDTRKKGLPYQWLLFIQYLPWLLYQVFLANIHVMYLVFHPKMMELIDPRIIRFKSRLNREMSHLIFANSITLTPGTITVFVSIYGDYAVHAIDEKCGQSLPGEMEKRVAKILGE